MNAKRLAGTIPAAAALLLSASAWAVMPSAGEPAVQVRSAAAGATKQGSAGTTSSPTDALVHLHRAVTGAYPPGQVLVDVRCCEAGRAAR